MLDSYQEFTDVNPSKIFDFFRLVEWLFFQYLPQITTDSRISDQEQVRLILKSKVQPGHKRRITDRQDVSLLLPPLSIGDIVFSHDFHGQRRQFIVLHEEGGAATLLGECRRGENSLDPYHVDLRGQTSLTQVAKHIEVIERVPLLLHLGRGHRAVRLTLNDTQLRVEVLLKALLVARLRHTGKEFFVTLVGVAFFYG